jgi:hypothetical protein
MSRHAIAAMLGAFVLASILTPAVASARNLGPVGLAIGSSNATPQPPPNRPQPWPRHFGYNPYNSNIFGLGTGGFGTGGPGGCPPSICGHQHPQDR